MHLVFWIVAIIAYIYAARLQVADFLYSSGMYARLVQFVWTVTMVAIGVSATYGALVTAP